MPINQRVGKKTVYIYIYKYIYITTEKAKNPRNCENFYPGEDYPHRIKLGEEDKNNAVFG